MNLFTLKPIIMEFYQSKRGYKDVKNISQKLQPEYKLIKNIFMYCKKDNSEYPISLTQSSRNLVLNILKNNTEIQEYLNIFLKEEDKYLNSLKQKHQAEYDLKQDLEKISSILFSNDPYWDMVLSDMKEQDYEEFIKNLLIIREKMIQTIHSNICKYSMDSILDYFDLEHIHNQLVLGEYKFNGLAMYMYEFLSEILNKYLKNHLEELFKKYKKRHG